LVSVSIGRPRGNSLQWRCEPMRRSVFWKQCRESGQRKYRFRLGGIVREYGRTLLRRSFFLHQPPIPNLKKSRHSNSFPCPVPNRGLPNLSWWRRFHGSLSSHKFCSASFLASARLQLPPWKNRDRLYVVMEYAEGKGTCTQISHRRCAQRDSESSRIARTRARCLALSHGQNWTRGIRASNPLTFLATADSSKLFQRRPIFPNPARRKPAISRKFDVYDAPGNHVGSRCRLG